jgi:DNA-binding NarL/FixJ family response regulator
MDPIRILLVDDHKLIRHGIQALLREDEDLIVVGEAENGKVALELINSTQPDVILMDIDMPVLSGIETTKIIYDKYPEIKVLALTMHDDPYNIVAFLRAGALGYSHKSINSFELKEAIITVYKGEHYIPADINDSILSGIMKQKPVSYNPTVNLTTRELEILKLISQGLTNTKIADKLSISKRTVDTHRQNLLVKLDLNNTASLIKYAVEHSLV